MEPDLSLERDRHLFEAGAKRILALDGGGVRGIVSLAYLERLEQILRQRHGDSFRLCDYFDLIGGTSTGSIIATGLALGMEVGTLIQSYLELSSVSFTGSRWHGGLFIPKFRSGPLLRVIQRFFGDITLGSEKLRTGLAIVAKRMDTRSVWVFHNCPRGPYFGPGDGDSHGVANRDLSLAALVRASTAAPTFFAPERIEVAKDISGVFVDGGVSPHNNPALLMLMLATLEGYGIRWQIGEDKLLLISIGTGSRPVARTQFPRFGSQSGVLAVTALYSLIDDGSWLAQALLQWLGKSPVPWTIDGEMGDLSNDQLGDKPLLRYLRYDLVLAAEWLRQELDISVTSAELKLLCAMDRPAAAMRLLELGRAAARKQILDEHLPASFDTHAQTIGALT